MNEYSKKSRTAFTAAFAVLLMLCASAVMLADDADATGEDLSGFGDVNEISIAPGYTWTYTSTFPSDLEAGTVLSFEKNEIGSLYATISGHTLTVSIPSGYTPGAYNIVLKAYHAESEQTAWQWIRITVNQALSVDYAGCVNEIIKGASQTMTLSSTGGIGTITWNAVSLPDGMTLMGNVVTGNPSTIGINEVKLQAVSDKGETKDLTITFTVYNKIKGGADETINAIGSHVASTAISQDGSDIGVTWTVTSGTLPAGFSLDAATGVVSGTYAGHTAGQAVIVLTGSSTAGPNQTATKKVTINYEPAFAITGGDSRVLTYTGNAVAKTVQLGISEDSSDLTWSVPETIGITIDQTGLLTITGSAAVTADGSITVSVQSANGQSATKTVQYLVEDTLSITGDSVLNAVVNGTKSTGAFTITGGSSNTVAISDNGGYASGLSWNPDSNVLTMSNYPEAHSASAITLTVTSAAGQTATAEVTVTVFSGMGFTSAPGATGIFAFVANTETE